MNGFVAESEVDERIDSVDGRSIILLRRSDGLSIGVLIATDNHANSARTT